MSKGSVSKWQRERVGRRAVHAAGRAVKEDVRKGGFRMQTWFPPRVRQGFAVSSIGRHRRARKPALTWRDINKLCYREVIALFLKGKKDYVWDSRQWRVLKEIKEELCFALENWFV